MSYHECDAGGDRSSISETNRNIEAMFERYMEKERQREILRNAILASSSPKPSKPSKPRPKKTKHKKSYGGGNLTQWKWRSHHKGASIACPRSALETIGINTEDRFIVRKHPSGTLITPGSSKPRRGVTWRQETPDTACVLFVNTSGSESWMKTGPLSAHKTKNGILLKESK